MARGFNTKQMLAKHGTERELISLDDRATPSRRPADIDKIEFCMETSWVRSRKIDLGNRGFPEKKMSERPGRLE